MLADITGRTIETVSSPQNVGAVGAAAITGVGLGVIDGIYRVGDFIPAAKTFKPNAANKPAYDKNYFVFKRLYKSNRNNFKLLNEK
jgi:xylulokinase